MEATYHILDLQENKDIFCYLYVIDIDKQKRQELALKNSEVFLYNIANLAVHITVQVFLDIPVTPCEKNKFLVFLIFV